MTRAGSGLVTVLLGGPAQPSALDTSFLDSVSAVILGLAWAEG